MQARLAWAANHAATARNNDQVASPSDTDHIANSDQQHDTDDHMHIDPKNRKAITKASVSKQEPTNIETDIPGILVGHSLAATPGTQVHDH